MSTTEDYRLLGVPTTLLGLGYRSWSKSDIRLVLDHYRWDYQATTETKLHLMHELDLLVQEYDLGPADRKSIFDARYNGHFPERRPRVRRVPHPTFPPVEVAGRKHSSRVQTKARTKKAARKAGKKSITTAPIPELVNELRRDCSVCFETLTVQNTPNRNVTLSCGHEPDVCTTCLCKSISTQLTSKVWDQIDCPTCGERLEYQDVQEFADSEVFGRLESTSRLHI